MPGGKEFNSSSTKPSRNRNPTKKLFVTAQCGGDRDLTAEILAMLKADRRGASILDRGLPDAAYRTIGEWTESGVRREFGSYRLKTVLGEGGMGVVWLGERRDAGNPVAIKFLPHAGLSPARRTRFTLEIKTLARLNHPFIARLYDAGSLDDGTPWFVMEYVNGVPLTDYAERHELPIGERLRIFRQVCQAVQYAHGQEIIHRDLKPSNILVEQDGTPRLLDFGIARELQSPDEPGERTRAGLRFLSPDYAAPEWVCEGTVGFFTDVYSLGVILYELLAGRRPRKNGSGVPERPSGDVKQLSPPGKAAWKDLDVLCRKAMHTDTQERYQSVEALIRDIDHYLNQEPLDAQPDALQYRMSKFVLRNRRAVLVTSLGATLAVFVLTFFTLRLAQERSMAVAEAARTRQIQQFMLNLFGAGDKSAAPSNDLRVVTLLDRGIGEAKALSSDPETQAELYGNLGRMYRMLGKYPQADELMAVSLRKLRALPGADNRRIADSLVDMGLSRLDQARFGDAERLIREGLTLARRYLPPDDPTVLKAQSSLGRVLEDSGAYDKAIAVLEPLARRQPSLQEERYELAASLGTLASARQNTGNFKAAETLHRRALAMNRQLFGNSNPRLGFELGEFAATEATLGNYAEAERMYRESLDIYRTWYGRNHADTALHANLLALSADPSGKERRG